MDLSLLLKVSDKFDINPLFVISGFILIYGLMGFSKINKELHNKKDEEIARLKKENEKLKDEKLEYEIKKGLIEQTEKLMEGLK